MLLFELSVPVAQAAFHNEQPFIYSVSPGIWETADYWTDAFGAPHESSNEILFISSFYRDGVNRYSPVSSLASCVSTESSFFWDNDAQVLYFHIEHDAFIIGPVWQYGKVQGFAKERAVYIGDIFYSPIIESVPSLEQSQDLEAYDTMAFMSGSVVLKNHNRDLDWMFETKPFGFECAMARLADSAPVEYAGEAVTLDGVALTHGVATRDCDSYSRSELEYLAAYYVEDFSGTLKQITLNLQDRRKAQNIKVPTELFTVAEYPDIDDSLIDKPIPLLYGTVRALTPVLLNGTTESGIVEYLIAQSIVSMGTVQVKKTVNDEDTWVTVTPATVDLATGIFTLTDAVGRDDNNNPYDCRVLEPSGAYPNPLDIINDLNERYLGAQYTDEEYDQTEWAAAKSDLANVGLYIDSQEELYSIIHTLQDGSSIGFRYEYNREGKRTARIDDWERELSFRIAREDIGNIEDVSVETDSDLLAASVKIAYAKDYSGTLAGDNTDDEDMLTVVDDSQKSAVQLAYRQEPQLEFESLLQTETQARAVALLKETRYSQARMIASVKILGSAFLSLRIYDIGIVELVPGTYDADAGAIVGPKWVGVWKAVVLGVNPDASEQTNEVTLALIEDVTDDVPIILSESSYLEIGGGVPLILG